MLVRLVDALSAVFIGLLAGAMLVIRAVLVPFWRGAPPAEFRGWFREHSGRIRRLMVPLGAVSGSLSLTAALARALSGRATRASAAAAASATGVVAITMTVNEPANEKFVCPELPDQETTRLLARWSRWHDARVVLGLVGAAAAVRALGEK